MDKFPAYNVTDRGSRDDRQSENQRGRWRRLSPSRRTADPYPQFVESVTRRSRSRAHPGTDDSRSSSSSLRRGAHSTPRRSRPRRRSAHSSRSHSRRDDAEPGEIRPESSTELSYSVPLGNVQTLLSALSTSTSSSVEASIHIDPVTNTATRAFVGPTPGFTLPHVLSSLNHPYARPQALGYPQAPMQHYQGILPPQTGFPFAWPPNRPEDPRRDLASSSSRRRSPSREPRWDRNSDGSRNQFRGNRDRY